MCTAIHLPQNTLFGRNLDLEYGYNETVTVMPRNFPLSLRHENTLQTHYATIGMATVVQGFPLYYDAINEYGLCCAALNFPHLARYASCAAGKKNIAVFELIPWLLAQCKTIEDVKAKLPFLNLVGTAFSPEMPTTSLHFMIADRNTSIVLEPTVGGIRCYDNPIGVMTNGPEFPCHLTNLQNYQNLSPLPPANGFHPLADQPAYSGALGAVGLPGDWSSASRFVRAAFVKCNTPRLENQAENINHFFRILQSVAMPMGSVQVKPGLHDITRYSCCCDYGAGIYYYTTYRNSHINAVDMRAENIESNFLITYPLLDYPSINLQNT